MDRDASPPVIPPNEAEFSQGPGLAMERIGLEPTTSALQRQESELQTVESQQLTDLPPSAYTEAYTPDRDSVNEDAPAGITLALRCSSFRACRFVMTRKPKRCGDYLHRMRANDETDRR